MKARRLRFYHVRRMPIKDKYPKKKDYGIESSLLTDSGISVKNEGLTPVVFFEEERRPLNHASHRKFEQSKKDFLKAFHLIEVYES